MLNAPPPAQQIEPKFDLVTHKRDKYGKIININHYRLHCIEGLKGFERPVGSGNLWYENNSPMGRIKETKNDKGHLVRSFDLGAEHVSFTPALTGDAKAAYELEALKNQSAALQAELEALRAEQKAATKTETKVETKGKA